MNISLCISGGHSRSSAFAFTSDLKALASVQGERINLHTDASSIPEMTIDDQLGIFASKIFHPEDGGAGCIAIEKTALFYVLTQKKLFEPRALNDFAKAALKRRDPQDAALRFGNLFDPSSPVGNEFWAANRASIQLLLNCEIFLVK